MQHLHNNHSDDFVSVVPEWSLFVLCLQCFNLFLWDWLSFSLGLWSPPYYRGGAAAHHSGQCSDTRSQPLRGTPAGSDRGMEKKHTETVCGTDGLRGSTASNLFRQKTISSKKVTLSLEVSFKVIVVEFINRLTNK